MKRHALGAVFGWLLIAGGVLLTVAVEGGTIHVPALLGFLVSSTAGFEGLGWLYGERGT